jgi:hypothetical protein
MQTLYHQGKQKFNWSKAGHQDEATNGYDLGELGLASPFYPLAALRDTTPLHVSAKANNYIATSMLLQPFAMLPLPSQHLQGLSQSQAISQSQSQAPQTETSEKELCRLPSSVLVCNRAGATSKDCASHGAQRFQPFVEIEKLLASRVDVAGGDAGRALRKAFDVALDDLSHGQERVRIRVENQVDDASPSSMMYVTHQIEGEGVVIDWRGNSSNSKDLVGCKCACGSGHNVPCQAKQATQSSARKLVHACEHAKWDSASSKECNYLCACSGAATTFESGYDMIGTDCGNRDSQMGITKRLCVFKTPGGERGWGLKTDERIEEGAFIAEYVGEIITDEEVQKRESRLNKSLLT